MTNTQCTLLMNSDSVKLPALAKEYGMEVAGPSERGGFLIRDTDGRAWLLSPLTPDNPMRRDSFGRAITESVWTALNVSRMNRT